MKKLNEQKQIIDNISHLLNQMKYEIDNLRAISYRYFLEYGYLEMKESIDLKFSIDWNISENTEKTVAKFIDYEKIGMTSNYQRIVDSLNKLK